MKVKDWISVSDRLPEQLDEWDEADKWKICCTGLGAVLLSLCYYDHKSGNWFDAFNVHAETRITHWMPLPPPPHQPR